MTRPGTTAAPPGTTNQPRRRHIGVELSARHRTLACVASMVAFVLWTHWGSGIPVFRSEVAPEPGWDTFRARYDVEHFGKDGQFVRAVQNGYHLVSYTYKYAPRFTRKTAADKVNSCVSCHAMEDFAYGFISSDRFKAGLGKRISFEEQVQRCYVEHLEGYVPTIHDPAVRDIRLLSRAIAHHLQLTEGALKEGS